MVGNGSKQKKNTNLVLLCFPFSVIGLDSPSLYRNMCKYRFKTRDLVTVQTSSHLVLFSGMYFVFINARQPQLSSVGLVGECAPILTVYHYYFSLLQ